jgi:hypothetical protein
MQQYRSKAQNLDKINLSILLSGLIGTVVGSMVFGLISNWAYALVLIISYILIGALVNKLTKSYSN